MLTITDAERAFYESVMEGVLADKPYSLSDLRLAYFLWRLDGGGGTYPVGNVYFGKISTGAYAGDLYVDTLKVLSGADYTGQFIGPATAPASPSPVKTWDAGLGAYVDVDTYIWDASLGDYVAVDAPDL